jgi:hypothetical protein
VVIAMVYFNNSPYENVIISLLKDDLSANENYIKETNFKNIKKSYLV